MARYASAAYIAAAEDHQLDAKRMALVKVELTVPSAKTLYLSTHDVITPDGQVWEGILDNVGPIEARSELLSEGPDLAVCPIRIARRKVAFQTNNAHTVLNLLNLYEWQGAAVTVYSWIEGLLSFSTDAQPEFVGTVTSYQPDPDGVEIQCKQGTAWAASFPDLFVNSTTFPGAPESAIGRVLPVIIGDRRAEIFRFRGPFIGLYEDDAYTKHDQVGGGSLVDAGVVVDTGRHSGKLVVLFSAHPLKTFAERSASNLYMRGGDLLAEIDPVALVTANDASGARFTVASDALICRTGAVPPDIDHGQENPPGAISACDIFATDTYAEMNNTAPNRQLALSLAALPPLGLKLSVGFCIAYSTAVGSEQLRVFPRVPSSGLEGLRTTLSLTGGIEVIGVMFAGWPQGGINGPWYGAGGDAWNFGGGVDVYHPQVDIVVDFAASNASNKARIFWVGLVPGYRPNRNVINPGYSPGQTGGYDLLGRRRTGQPRPGEQFFGGRPLDAIGAVKEIQSDFFHNSRGWADDGSGTYTGTAAALIERPADVARLLLLRYGGVSSGLIETGVGVLGSFVDARTAHRTIEGLPMRVARCVDQTERVSDAVASLARETAAICLISRRTGKYNWITWDIDAPTNYDRTLTADDVLDGVFVAERQTESDIINQIRTRYGHDAFRNGRLHNTFLAPGLSGGGFSCSGRRDQNLTIVASVTDRLDFNVSGTGDVVASLTPGDYTGSSAMQHVRTQMKAVGGATDILVQWGFEVVANENDFLTVAGFTITIAAGSYATGTALATQVQTQLNAAGTGLTWTVTYTTDAKFTFAATGAFVLDWTRGAAANKVAALLFGFDPGADTASGTTATGAIPCFAETFRMARAAGTMTLYPDSGTNKARSAWPLLGFDPLWDRPSVLETATRIYTAYTRVGIRERHATASKTAHGARPELTLDTQWLNTTQMAATLRDRVFDWRVEQPTRIRFATLRMPDIDRGMVFPLDASLDTLMPYSKYDPSASWAGRRAMVLEVRRDVASKHIQEIVAVEVARVARDGASSQPPGAIGVAAAGTPATTVGTAFTMFTDNGGSGTVYQTKVAKVNPDQTIPWTAGGVQLGSALSTPAIIELEHAVLAMSDGGCICVWVEPQVTNNTTFKLYAQRLDAYGAKLWSPSTGIVVSDVCPGAAHPIFEGLNICSDGQGGCVIAWSDERVGGSPAPPRVCVQRLNSDGTALWTAGGVALTNAAYSSGTDRGDYNPVPVLLPTGDVMVVWNKLITGAFDTVIYGQRITISAGAAQLTAGGVATTLRNTQAGVADYFTVPKVWVSTDGALFIFGFLLTGSDKSARVRKIDYSMVQIWQTDAVEASNADDIEAVAGCSDGAGGAFVCYREVESSLTRNKVRRINSAGAAQWSASVIVLTEGTAATYSGGPVIECAAVPDGLGGCYVFYTPADTTAASKDFYAAHVDTNGAVTWGPTALTSTHLKCGTLAVVSDGMGGAYVSWDRFSSSPVGHRVGRVNLSGLQFPVDGVSLSTVAPLGNDRGSSALATPVGVALHD